MPTLEYRGDYGTSVTLASARTASLTLNGTAPSTPILVSSAYARIYVSTASKALTFQYHVVTNGNYAGDKSYKFANNDDPQYIDVPIDVTALDPSFPCKTIDTITVSETGDHGSSTRIRGLVRIFVEYVNVGEPTAPTNLRINGETAINLEAEHQATLTWDAAQLGAYDSSLSYRIRRYSVETGTYTLIGYTSNLYYTITAPNDDSKSYYYYVDSYTLYWLKSSTTFASIYTYIQITVPTVYGGGSNPVYNPRPMFLLTLGNGPSNEYLTLIASGWTPSRQGYPGDHVYLLRDSTYQQATSDTITITETDQLMRSVDKTLAVSYAAPSYTNETVEAGTTIVKAADITELQTALANIRTAYGMTAYTFTACVAGVTSLTMWATHIAELQACITEIKNYINAWDSSSTLFHVILPAFITTPGPSAAVINQLRTMVTML